MAADSAAPAACCGAVSALMNVSINSIAAKQQQIKVTILDI